MYVYSNCMLHSPLELSRVRFLPLSCNRHIRFPHIFTMICLIKFPWSRIDCERLPLDSYMVCLGALAPMMPWIVTLASGLQVCGCALSRTNGYWNEALAVAVLLHPTPCPNLLTTEACCYTHLHTLS